MQKALHKDAYYESFDVKCSAAADAAGRSPTLRLWSQWVSAMTCGRATGVLSPMVMVTRPQAPRTGFCSARRKARHTVCTRYTPQAPTDELHNKWLVQVCGAMPH